MAFCVLYPLYLHVANVIRFDSNSAAVTQQQPVLSLGKGLFLQSQGFKVYMIVFQVFTVLLPILVLILLPSNQASPAVPPLLLLLVQVAMEIGTRAWHDVPRLLVPIGFNAYRLPSLAVWLQATYYQAVVASDGFSAPAAAHMALAGINLVMWSYNLFVFLLLRVLPVYLDERDSPTVPVQWKWYLFPVTSIENTTTSSGKKSS
jgi:hypothetical protein